MIAAAQALSDLTSEHSRQSAKKDFMEFIHCRSLQSDLAVGGGGDRGWITTGSDFSNNSLDLYLS